MRDNLSLLMINDNIIRINTYKNTVNLVFECFFVYIFSS